MHLEEALDAAEIVVLAVPSSVILDVVESILWYLRPSHVLLDLAKGLAPGKRLISGAIESMLDDHGLRNPLAVLTGPTIAPEAADGVMTTALVASHDASVASRLAKELSTPTFILHATDDPIGAELWGAFKNVVALACGLVDGLAKIGSLGGDNLKRRQSSLRGSGKDVSSCPCSDRILRPPSDLLDWVICTSPPPAPLAGTGGWARSSGQASTSIRP